jgi:type IV pilus assembly protein PilB
MDHRQHHHHHHSEHHHHANPEVSLLKLLVTAGLVETEQAHAAEEAIVSGNTTAIEYVARNFRVDDDYIARTIAERLHLPYVSLPTQALNPSTTSLVREDLAAQSGMIPLRAPDGSLVVATANPLNTEAKRRVEFATGRRVHIEVASFTAVRDALQHAYHLADTLNTYLEGIPEESDVPVAEITEERLDIKGLMRETNLPPVVKLLNVVLLEGIRTSASDVLIEPHFSEVRVRYRVHGVLEESFRLPKWIQDPLVARCKALAKLDITERRVPQDGRINMRYRDAMIDLRVSSLPTQFGEKVTMRILDPGSAPDGLHRLHLSQHALEIVRRATTRPEGMIIVTGPTGSGKTTTLYAMLAEIVSSARNVVTIENPIEYQLRGVNQVEINERQGLTFANTLRSILRQDPDVILVGEIRDQETAEIALRAAQTGHLVLSTLHTNDTAATISRLLDLKIEPYMLASSLHLILAQRLVRKVCEHCAEPYEPEPATLRALHLDMNGEPVMRGRGCGACRRTGFSGRLAVFEVMPIDRKLAALIESRAPEVALRSQAHENGMQLLSECAIDRVRNGLTTVEEVRRVVDVTTTSARCPTCEEQVEDNSTVCRHCGTTLRKTCGSCGLQIQKEWMVCPYCGSAAKANASAAASPPPAAPASVVARAISEGSATRQFRTLVVDDQADMRRLVAHTLEHSGLPIVVSIATNGQEAVEAATDEPPDLIVLDVMMPEMDGFEVCEQLRKNVRTAFTPILMLTALDDAGSRARGFHAGTDDYISKPFARAELLARVRRLLERSYGALLPMASEQRRERPPAGGSVVRLSA